MKNDNNKDSFGKRFAELRKARGLTQEAVAEKVSVSGQAVSKWENDISYPDITLLPDLADLLGVSLDELMGRKTASVEQLPEDQRKPFRKMVLRILVTQKNGETVNIKIPMPMVKAGVKMGMKMGGNKSLESVDFNEIIKMVEQGMIGEVMEVETEDGEVVHLIIE